MNPKVPSQNGKSSPAPGSKLERLLFPSALLILLLSANQQSYAPKQGIHTVVHVTPADILIWVVGLTLVLPYLERVKWGRICSWILLPCLAAGAVIFSHRFHDFVSIIHHGPHGSHLKGAVGATGLLALAVWQLARLLPLSTAGRPGKLHSSNGNDGPIPGPLKMPQLPTAVWALLAVGFLSAVTMVLPSESLHDWLHNPDAQEPIRKAVLFLVQMVQHLGIALFLFLVVLRSPGRIRLSVRILLLGALVCVLVAVPQYIHYIHQAMHSLGGIVLPPPSTTTDHTGPLVEGLMQSRKVYGGYLCMVLPLALGSLLGARRKPVRLLYGAFLGLAMVTILSGAAFWCALLGLAVTGICYGDRERWRVPILCLALSLVILASPWNRRHLVHEFFRYRAPVDAPISGPVGTASPAGASGTVENPSPLSTGKTETPAPLSSTTSETPEPISSDKSETPAPLNSVSNGSGKTETPEPISSARSETPAPVGAEKTETPAPLSANQTETPAPLSAGTMETPAPITSNKSETPAPIASSHSETPEPISTETNGTAQGGAHQEPRASEVASAASSDAAAVTSLPPIKKEYMEWIAGIYMTSEHFWLGVGPGQYQVNIGQYYGQDPNPDVRLERDSNNLYLVYAASLGLAGLIALLQVILAALSQSWRVVRRKSILSSKAPLSLHEWWHSAEGVALAAGVCGALTSFLFVNLFTSLLVRGAGIAFAFLLALAASMSQGDTAKRH